MASSETDRTKILKSLPQPTSQKEVIPPPCSITKSYPDILLRNDGFNAEVAYAFDSFYARLVYVLGNMVRMEIPGAVLQLIENEHGEEMINVLLLYEKRRQLIDSVYLSADGDLILQQTPAGEPSILHQHPELWSFEGSLPNSRKVKFTPVYDIPLNYVAEARSGGLENRHLETPAMVIAFGRTGIVYYAYEHYLSPQKPKALNTLPDDDIINALKLISKKISAKLVNLLPDQELPSPEIEVL